MCQQYQMQQIEWHCLQLQHCLPRVWTLIHRLPLFKWNNILSKTHTEKLDVFINSKFMWFRALGFPKALYAWLLAHASSGLRSVYKMSCHGYTIHLYLIKIHSYLFLFVVSWFNASQLEMVNSHSQSPHLLFQFVHVRLNHDLNQFTCPVSSQRLPRVVS